MTNAEVLQQINSRKRANEFDTASPKRLKHNDCQSLKVSKIIFPRSRIFYSLGRKTLSRQKWIIGLPREHSLQKIKCGTIQINDLIKSVFPGCFGMPSIINNYKNFSNNEQVAVPKRLDNISKLLQILVYRHSVCNYEALFDYYCPKPVLTLEGPPKQAIEYHLEHDQVVSYVMAVLSKVFPMALWGTVENRKLIYACIFIEMKDRD
jgi:hypothetical protein